MDRSPFVAESSAKTKRNIILKRYVKTTNKAVQSLLDRIFVLPIVRIELD